MIVKYQFRLFEYRISKVMF